MCGMGVRLSLLVKGVNASVRMRLRMRAKARPHKGATPRLVMSVRVRVR